MQLCVLDLFLLNKIQMLTHIFLDSTENVVVVFFFLFKFIDSQFQQHRSREI